MQAHRIAMLGTGLIADFYLTALHGQRGRDRVVTAFSRSAERSRAFAARWGITASSTSMEEAIGHPEVDVVVVALPNHLHEEAILQAVERAGVFAGYLEDLVYTPKTLKAAAAVRAGAIGDVTWVRSREAHPGPHSAWFWDTRQAGGGAIIDLGCHCIEIIRTFVGKGNRPVEVMCQADTLVHPIEAEDNAVALVRFESGAIGQFEVSWTFRGGMDLRDEIAGTEGTIRLDHFLRTGFEMYSGGGQAGYVAEKVEATQGWLFPVGDEAVALGYVDMFTDMFAALEAGRDPRETLYDGYIVNAVMDAAYRSARSRAWEPVELEWRGGTAPRIGRPVARHDGHAIVKSELLPDGRRKLILSHRDTGAVFERIVE